MKESELRNMALNPSRRERLKQIGKKWGEKAQGTDHYQERDFDTYQTVLGFTEEQLKGKNILNIGSSYKELFEREAKKKNIRVVSINPNLRDGLVDGRIVGDNPVAAYIQNLPFPDNTFDYEFSHLAVPEHLKSEDFNLAYGEIYRTLKPGGIFISGPHVS